MELLRPSTNIIFRIQSPDTLTCMELVDSPGSELMNVRLRPPTDTEYQYWRFDEITGPGVYYVRNVRNSNLCLYYHESKVYAGKASIDPGMIEVWYENGAYRLYFSKNGTDKLWFYTDYGDYDIIHAARSPSVGKLKLDWLLVPVTLQPIAKLLPGSYRIRSLDGKNLLTMPEKSAAGSTNVYVRSQLDQTLYQRWTLTLKSTSNGQYSIQNDGDKLYLGCSAAPAVKGHGLVGLEKEYLWDIYSVGGFAWSLRIPAAGLSIGVANYEIEDMEEVSLVPSDNTSSQLWFMEKYVPIGENKVYAKREVEEGMYLLQTSKDGSTYMAAYSAPWRIVPGTTTTSKFELKYIDKSSARFKLIVANTNPAQEVAVITDDIEYIGLKHTGTEFVLLEKNKGEPGHVICLPDSGRPLRVVSSRTTTDNNKNRVFAIDNKVAGDLGQMWTLVPMPK